jgi:hypothetical protein
MVTDQKHQDTGDDGGPKKKIQILAPAASKTCDCKEFSEHEIIFKFIQDMRTPS